MKTILVVEDEVRLAQLYEIALKESGYNVIVANDGTTALNHLSSSTPDLMMLDIGLPDISGLEILKKIREKSATLPTVVMCTADKGFKENHKNYTSKISAYFEKPVGLGELRKKIKELIGE